MVWQSGIPTGKPWRSLWLTWYQLWDTPVTVYVHKCDIQILASIAHKAARLAKQPVPEACPSLIVIPPNLLMQWPQEIQSICRRLQVYIYHGDMRISSTGLSALPINGKLTRGHEIFNKNNPENAQKIVITTYQTLAPRHGPAAVKRWCQANKQRYNDNEPYMPSDSDISLTRLFSCVVFDEAHNLRNPGSSLSLAAKWLNADFNLLLTATPLYNSIHDLKGYAPLVFGIWGHSGRHWVQVCLQSSVVQNESQSCVH